MANEDSALREVDQALDEDRQWESFRKHGPTAIAVGVALVVFVAGWQIYKGIRDRGAEAAAVEFSEAVDTLAEDPFDGRSALQSIAENGDGGYSVLAGFRRAASLAADGSNEAAIDAFVEIYSDGSTPGSLKDLARIRAGYLALADGRDAALAHIGGLANDDGPYRFHANEIAGIAALSAEDYETAYGIFTELSSDIATPATLSARAKKLAALALAGKSDVNLSGGVDVDNITRALGADGEPPAAIDAEALIDTLLDEDGAAEIVPAESETETVPSDNDGPMEQAEDSAE